MKDLFIILLIGCFVRWPSLYGTFTFDDGPAILQNQDVVEQSTFLAIFHHDFWGKNLTSKYSHKSYRPLTTLTFKINHFLSPSSSSSYSYHAFNIFVHTLNCLLAFLILKRISSGSIATISSILFATHPLHTEPTSGLVGRADLLYAFFTLSALLVTLIKVSSWHKRLFVTLVLSSLSLFCKEQGIMTVPMVLCVEVLKRHGLKFTTTWRLPSLLAIHVLLKKLLVYSIYMVCMVYLRLYLIDFKPPVFQAGDNPSASIESLPWRLLNYSHIYTLNAWLLVCPEWLCFDWSLGCVPTITYPGDLRLLGSLSLWILILLLVYNSLYYYRSKSLMVALVLLVLPFVPSTNLFFTVGFVVAERNLYLSVLGYSLLVAIGYSRLDKFKRLKKPLLSIVVLAFACKSLHRCYEWQTEEKLFKSGLKVCPNNAKVHYNIAKIAANHNKTYEAVVGYRKAIQLYPIYEHAMNNLGNLLKSQAKYAEAKSLFVQALEINPDFAACWMNLGVVQTHLKEYMEAEMSYMKALGKRKIYPDCHYNLGTLYLKLRKHDKAVEAFGNAIKDDPRHFGARANTVILLDELERFEAAEKECYAALQLFPDKSDFYFHLGNIYGKTNRFVQAEQHYLTAIKIEANKHLYHVNIGVLYHRWKKFSQAEEHYKKALQLDPSNQSAARNLQSLKGKT